MNFSDATANSLGAAGFAVTAMTTNAAGYTMVGVKPSGSTRTYAADVRQTAGFGLDDTATSLGENGYVVTTMVTNSAGYTMVGVR